MCGEQAQSVAGARAPANPRDVGDACDAIRLARHREEQIAQPIHVANELIAQRLGRRELNHHALCATGDRAGHVEVRTRERSAGQDERLERLQRLVEGVDGALESRGVVRADLG